MPAEPVNYVEPVLLEDTGEIGFNGGLYETRFIMCTEYAISHINHHHTILNQSFHLNPRMVQQRPSQAPSSVKYNGSMFQHLISNSDSWAANSVIYSATD